MLRLFTLLSSGVVLPWNFGVLMWHCLQSWSAKPLCELVNWCLNAGPFWKDSLDRWYPFADIKYHGGEWNGARERMQIKAFYHAHHHHHIPDVHASKIRSSSPSISRDLLTSETTSQVREINKETQRARNEINRFHLFRLQLVERLHETRNARVKWRERKRWSSFRWKKVVIMKINWSIIKNPSWPTCYAARNSLRRSLGDGLSNISFLRVFIMILYLPSSRWWRQFLKWNWRQQQQQQQPGDYDEVRSFFPLFASVLTHTRRVTNQFTNSINDARTYRNT